MKKLKVDIGYKIGKWTVIAKCSDSHKLLCRCECGFCKEQEPSNIYRGKSKQCKKCKDMEHSKNKLDDLTGKSFGEWTVLEKYGKRRKEILWLCLCTCGKQFKVTGNALRGGTSKKCKYCNHYNDIKGIYWSRLKRCAKKRKIDFNITIEEAWQIYIEQNKKCALTGKIIDFENCTASLDRIDSNKSYYKENCQWVHKDINFMKYTFSVNKFISLCEEVVEFNRRKYE